MATEHHVFSRQELYDLVWSEPMRDLASKYNISDRGLAKACAAADIPVPERGYWAKLHAGKSVSKRALPPRGLGKSDDVRIGGSRWGYYGLTQVDHLNDPIPPPPIFEVEIDVIRSQVVALVDRAPLPKNLTKPHRLIAGLLNEDDARRQKYLASPYRFLSDAPIFETPFERRRLKILSGLFTCLEGCRTRPSIGGKQARELSITVGDQSVSFSLDSANAEKQLERERAGYGFVTRGNKDKMSLTLSNWRQKSSAQSWQDKDGDPLENHLRAFVIELIVAGEESYRSGRIAHHSWLIERKAEAQEEARKRKLEAERKRHEREAGREKARIDHLLNEAHALHQANEIRAYMTAVQEANAHASQLMTPEAMASWVSWALAQADRIDPITSRRYCELPIEENE
jgi:hypothetical protein